MHHCIPEMLEKIRLANPGDILFDYRTGFVPQIYPGNRIKLTEFGTDKILAYVEVLDVTPVHVVPDFIKARYNRPFNAQHWFFCFKLKIESVEHEGKRIL